MGSQHRQGFPGSKRLVTHSIRSETLWRLEEGFGQAGAKEKGKLKMVEAGFSLDGYVKMG
jgi:hypothetical protein